MTWQHFLRTLAIAILGACALALASQARAEGGDVDGLVSPDQAKEFLDAAAAEAAAPLPGEEAAAETPDAKKPAKAGKGAEKKAKEAVVSKAEKPDVQGGASPASTPAQAASAAVEPVKQEIEDETASLSVAPIDAKLKLRQSDTVRSGALKPLITRYASENGLPFELANAVVRLESRYNAGARNGPNMGLTQINVRTAQSLGYQGPAAGLLDPETNLRYGLKYLAKAYKLAGGDICGTILRYQFGHRTQTMTGASRAYCAKVKVITAAAE